MSLAENSTYNSSNGPLPGKLSSLVEEVKSRVSRICWRANAVFSHALGRLLGYSTPESNGFDRRPIFQCKLSLQTLSALQSLILNSPIVEFRAADHARGYLFNPNSEAITRIFNDGYRFRGIDQSQLRGISAALAEIAPAITCHIGSGWRVINLKSWSTRADTVKAGPNAWHLDGFPAGTYKLMIYLTPIGSFIGTTEVRFDDGSSTILEGDAGTYLLFDPSALWHRGIAPHGANVERTIIEITLMRSLSIDLRLVNGGLNSAYPRLPWARRPICAA